MGAKATAMKITMTGENGEYTLTRTQRVPSMENYGYDVFALAIQNNGGNVNVAMEPWKSGHTWGFYTYTNKTVLDQLYDLAEQCDYYQFIPGTTFGYYDADKVAAFEAALKAAHDADGQDEISEEEAQKLLDALQAALDAVQGAFMRIPAGYYRIVSGLAGFTSQQGEDAVKAMYADGTAAKWGNVNNEESAYLWKVEPLESDVEAYTLVNLAGNLHYGTVSQSAAISLTDAEDGVYAFIEIAGYDEDGKVNFDIRPSSSSKGGYGYVHCGGHGNGSGTSGSLVGWCNTFDNGGGASEWMLQTVTPEEAEAIINAQGDKDKQNALNNELHALIDAASARYYATGNFTMGDALITDGNQFYSPFSQNDLGGGDGGNLTDGVLIDGDASTYWHSYYGAGAVPGGTQWLQVDLQAATDKVVELDVVRRTTLDDHVKKMTVFGSQDEENWAYVTTLVLDNYYTGMTYTTAPFSTDGHRYLRFRVDDTYYSGGDTRGYFHFAEFQLYVANLEAGCQLDRIKDSETAKALLAAIATAKGIENATQADIDALQAALDAFAGVSVDPSELNALIEQATTYVQQAEVGEDPGFVTEAGKSGLEAELEKAVALMAGDYTADQIAAEVAALQAALDACAPIKIELDKWYNISWNGKYWTGTNALGDDPTAASAQFRFLAMDGDRVAIQNRQSGFLAIAPGTYHYMSIGYTNITRYLPEYPGNGTVEFKANSWADDDYGYIEVYNQANMVSHKGGKTGLTVTAAEEDGEEDPLQGAIKFTHNAAYIFTVPTGIKGADDNGAIYDVVGCYTDEEGLKLALNEHNFDEGIIEPGTPFLLCAGDIVAEVDTVSDNAVTIYFTWGDKIAMEPAEGANGIIGTYTALTGISDAIVMKDGRPIYTTEPSAVSAFRGYIKITTPVEENAGELNLIIPGADENFEVSINDALANVNKAGTVYNLSGMVVAKNATLRDLKALGSGTYILNGVKVIVK